MSNLQNNLYRYLACGLVAGFLSLFTAHAGPLMNQIIQDQNRMNQIQNEGSTYSQGQFSEAQGQRVIPASDSSEALGTLAEASDEELERTYDGALLAQIDADDTYDPFADYSEFEEATEEEADINFFRNGRFFTIGFHAGYRAFTENLGDLYSDGTTFGLFLSYFFDLRFALQLTFLTGDHTLEFTSPANTFIRGTVSLTHIGLDLKYYMNTQNVTRGLAQLNPYVVGGFHQIFRTVTVTGQSAFSKEGALGFNIGGGIEIPMMRNKMYFGFQGNYILVSFKDENSEIILAGNESTGIFPTGDIIQATLILGINF